MRHSIGLAAILFAAAIGSVSAAPAHKSTVKPGRVRQLFDSGWRYAPDRNAETPGIPISDWKVLKTQGLNMMKIAAVPGYIYERAEETHAGKIGQDEFAGRYGLAWFTTDLHDSSSNSEPQQTGSKRKRVLHFESVDDNCVVYLNGRKVAEHKGWDDEFEVDLTNSWVENSPNKLTLLVENTGGTGGIMKPVHLLSGKPEPDDLGPVAPAFNDGPWRTVHLPHDFVVEGVFDPKEDPSHGSLAAGQAWYRKTFTVPESSKGKSLWIDFDGVYRDAKVWLNGKELGSQPSGYIGFRFDIAGLVKFDAPNVLAVHVNAHKQEGWWYEGGGIYRHVWLTTADPVHIAPWGVYVRPQVQGPETDPVPAATLHIETTVVNSTTQPQTVEVRSAISAPDGNEQLAGSTQAHLGPGETRVVVTEIEEPKARLWSVEKPRLYRLVSSVIRHGAAADSTETAFGIRTIRFDAAKGFFLNGQPVKLKGTCNHQDFSGVGIGMPDSLLSWRIKKLKEMGSNAYRCSHNPPAAELLDACDRQGMLVMDETRHLGDTYAAKTPNGTPATDLADLKAMLLRDRNHPSIIIWSMCNEEPLQGNTEGARIFTAMKDVVHQYDGTMRPVSCAMNGGWGYGITNVQDLQGANYNPGGYDSFHKSYPNMPFYGSETASTVSTRGIYTNDTVRGYVSAYDVNFPPWAQTAEAAWKPIAERDYVAGGFVWTGFDYKGEPTPYEWPCINSHFGIMDECGFPKDNWFYYKAWWDNKPIVHILPHWNWPGKEGQNISVWCHSNCEKVELLLNGTSLGKKNMPRNGHLEWQVPYTAGKLEARGFNSSGLTALDTVETAGAPAALRITTDRRKLHADGEDVTMVAAAVVDARGNVVPTADNLVVFSANGQAATIAGVGNGDASSHEPDRASQRHAFNGLCMAVVQAAETQGQVKITASAPGLKSATVTIDVRK